jgi:hypothetical protein
MEPTLFSRLTAPVLQVLRNPSPDVRALWLAGALYVASGLVHALIWLAAGSPSLEGPVSWRKPIVFGLSGGVTTLSLAWLAAWVPASKARARWSWTYVVTMTAELLLIDLQCWRGVGSHFNVSTPLDSAVFSLMGLLICAAMFAAWRLGASLRAKSRASLDVLGAAAWAVRFLMLGTAVGIGMAVHGSVVQVMGGTPSVLGAAGSLKLVHAIALHGLQVFPLLLVPLSWLGLDAPERSRRLGVAAAGYALLFVAAVVQAALGRAPVDLSLPAGLFAVAGLVTLGASLRPAAPALRTSRAA